MGEDIRFKNKIIGTLNDGVFRTHRDKRHFFVKFKGFGLSSSIIDELKRRNCRSVLLIYTKSDNSESLYLAPLMRFYEKGEIWKDGEDDWQRILPLTEWVKIA